MPFQPFTPPPEPGRHHELTGVRQHKPRPEHHKVVTEAIRQAPITTPAQLRKLPSTPYGEGGEDPNYTKWQHLKDEIHDIPTWIKVLFFLALFIAFWWVSMPFRGLMIVIGIFWFFALGAHPVTHMGRAVGDVLDGDD